MESQPLGSSGATDARRRLPAMDRLLDEPAVQRLSSLYGREVVRVQARAELDLLRRALEAEPGVDLQAEIRDLPERLSRSLVDRLGSSLRRVLNATGIFLHTNLGRSPLPRAVTDLLPELTDAYCDLEYDLASGRRGRRSTRASGLLAAASGAAAGLVVNNNAAAVFLVLSALARGRDVIISRGELVEIGGSFRIPDILETAGARLVEVGTTNRTRVADYERAIGPETALLLKVHPSNYRISGFVEEATAAQLARLGRQRGVPLLVDEGSGLLRPHRAPQLRDHASFQELVAQGCDLVCGSGDKLLGGPQSGLLVGRADLVERCARHPLYRVLRPDRVVFAALEAVLGLHATGERLPLDRMWPESDRPDGRRLESVAAALGAEIVQADAFLGGGAAPEEPIPGRALALPDDDGLLRRLRVGEPPVVGYLREGRLILDLRTVDPIDDTTLIAAVRAARR